MISLIKKDLLINSWYSYVGFGVFIIGAYVIAFPPYFICIAGFIAFSFSVFTYDDKHHVNRFLLSIPITRNKVVQSRYLYCMIIMISIITLQTTFMTIFSSFLSESHFMYSWRDMIILFCIGLMIIAVFLPMLHAFQTVYYPFGILLVLLGASIFGIIDLLVDVLEMKETIIFNDLDAGFVLLVEKYIPYEPYLLLLLLSGVLLLVSMMISTSLFAKKDQ